LVCVVTLEWACCLLLVPLLTGRPE
jgi:hypothetical protein